MNWTKNVQFCRWFLKENRVFWSIFWYGKLKTNHTTPIVIGLMMFHFQFLHNQVDHILKVIQLSNLLKIIFGHFRCQFLYFFIYRLDKSWSSKIIVFIAIWWSTTSMSKRCNNETQNNFPHFDFEVNEKLRRLFFKNIRGVILVRFIRGIPGRIIPLPIHFGIFYNLINRCS